ncbi:uncharacterized protein LOC107474426 [Arachis duranensis]|uniref:Uncharacterized protein LOC107474426 n=1 Tax=Arachis duranensis TaxID=130453 RepID=A0A6P4CDR6_ARADU|nr:uncharacterized protein LOC107474426 [Arachis duranensis]
MDFEKAGDGRKLQLQELENLRQEAYENSRLYEEKVKAVHDKLRLMPDKLRSRWDGPYQVEKAEPYGVFHLSHPSSSEFIKVNGYRLKLYHGEKMQKNKELEIFLLEDPPTAGD